MLGFAALNPACALVSHPPGLPYIAVENEAQWAWPANTGKPWWRRRHVQTSIHVMVAVLLYLSASLHVNRGVLRSANFELYAQGWQVQEYVPPLNVESESDIDAFLNVHPGGRIWKAYLFPGRITPVVLDRLAQLDGLEFLSYSGNDLHWTERDGRIFFPPVLTDEQFRIIAKIRSLKIIEIWYGSLSPWQRAHLQRENPGCEVRDNMNVL